MYCVGEARFCTDMEYTVTREDLKPCDAGTHLFTNSVRCMLHMKHYPCYDLDMLSITRKFPTNH